MSDALTADILRKSFDLSLDMVCLAGVDGYFKDLNPAWERTLGYSREELLTKPYLDFVHPDDRESTIAEATRLSKGEPVVSFENRYRAADGSWKWLFWKSVLLPDSDSVFAIARDVTDRKEYEAAMADLNRELERRIDERTAELQKSNESLRASERTLSTLFSNLPGMAYRCQNDPDWTMDYLSEGVFELTGHQAHELTKNRVVSYADLIHPEDRAMVNDAVQGAVQRNAPFQIEYRIRTAAGQEKWVWEKGRGIYDDDGALLHLEGLITDVTERKRSEGTIREQAALINEARDAIFVRNLEDEITFWNKGAERLFGWTSDEVHGKRASDLLSSGSSSEFEEAMKTTIEQGSWDGEFREKTKDGKDLLIESRWTLLRDGSGKPSGALSIATDITQRKHLEEQVLRAQRMESVGTLASGIAHDLNNALTPVLMAVQILKRKYGKSEDRTLDMLESGAKRGARLVKQVLTFGRGMAGEPILLQIRHQIKEFEKTAEQTFPKDIRLNIDVPKDLWSVSADPTQLDQVLMNLSVNARDAMPDGGTLTMRAKNVSVDATYAHMQPDARPGSYVQIEVADTGEGMPDGVRQRVFEPFFTTKEVGKGTGLGLSTTHTIVKNHGGFINVYSEVGRGSTFKVYLPAVEGEVEERVDSEPVLFEGHGQTVLVADDDPVVREMVATVLEDSGYRVTAATNGAEAVARYANGGVDVALIDWEMPVMNGKQAVEAIRNIAPDARIIAASGISHVGQLNNLDRPVPFLSKPFTAEDLLGKLAELLGDTKT